jgi:hypothetical protein
LTSAGLVRIARGDRRFAQGRPRRSEDDSRQVPQAVDETGTNPDTEPVVMAGVFVDVPPAPGEATDAEYRPPVSPDDRRSAEVRYREGICAFLPLTDLSPAEIVPLIPLDMHAEMKEQHQVIRSWLTDLDIAIIDARKVDSSAGIA